MFPLVIHSFDLVVSSVGIFSIRGTRESGVLAPMEDPMAILQKGYSVTIVLAIVAFGLVIVTLYFVYFNLAFLTFSGLAKPRVFYMLLFVIINLCNSV